MGNKKPKTIQQKFSVIFDFPDVCGILLLGVGDHIASHMHWSNLIEEYFANDGVFVSLLHLLLWFEMGH